MVVWLSLKTAAWLPFSHGISSSHVRGMAYDVRLFAPYRSDILASGIYDRPYDRQ